VPTLDIGDRVLVSKLNRTPGRGDIVVFNRPSNDPPQSPDDPKVLIKRVIGLPGETVEARDGKVYVDGKALDESYLPKGTVTTIAKPITVPKGEILVLGDNRGVSQDGRYFGPIPENLIVGRAILRIWPLSRFGTL
jgi:signal peptidase I